MSCTSSLIAVEVAPGVQAYIAVAVAQVGADAIITFAVHLQLICSWSVRLAAQREHVWTLLCRPLHYKMVPSIWPDVHIASMQAGSTWQLALKKGHRLVNRTGQLLQMLHRCPLGLQAFAAGPIADMITIEPGEVSLFIQCKHQQTVEIPHLKKPTALYADVKLREACCEMPPQLHVVPEYNIFTSHSIVQMVLCRHTLWKCLSSALAGMQTK